MQNDGVKKTVVFPLSRRQRDINDQEKTCLLKEVDLRMFASVFEVPKEPLGMNGVAVDFVVSQFCPFEKGYIACQTTLLS